MQEEALKEKQAVQQRLQSAVDMQSALEKAYQAKVSRTCCLILPEECRSCVIRYDMPTFGQKAYQGKAAVWQ